MGPSINPDTHNNSNNNNNHNTTSATHNRNISHVRKYFVVLHDCLAVKFLAIGAPGTTGGDHIRNGHGTETGNGTSNRRIRRNSEQYNEAPHGYGHGNSHYGTLNTKNSIGNNNNSSSSSSSSSAQSPSLQTHGLSLFKVFTLHI